MTGRVALAAAIVLVPLIGYPVATLAGGSPRFPTRDECAPAAIEGKPVDVVFGRFDDPETAATMRDQVVAVGFKGTDVLPDGCGRWKVVLENVPSLEIAHEIQEEAATVDLRPTSELAAGN